MIVREAMAFRKLLSEMPIRVQPDEFFVGTLVQTLDTGRALGSVHVSLL